MKQLVFFTFFARYLTSSYLPMWNVIATNSFNNNRFIFIDIDIHIVDKPVIVLLVTNILKITFRLCRKVINYRKYFPGGVFKEDQKLIHIYKRNHEKDLPPVKKQIDREKKKTNHYTRGHIEQNQNIQGLVYTRLDLLGFKLYNIQVLNFMGRNMTSIHI